MARSRVALMWRGSESSVRAMNVASEAMAMQSGLMGWSMDP